MTLALPPSMQADWLVLRRAGSMALVRPIAAPAVLVSGCVVLACVSLYWGYAWCTAMSALFALAGSFSLTRSRLTTALAHARFGWCGALPTSPRTLRWTLVALSAGALLVAVSSCSALLALASIPAPRRDALDLALLALDGGLAVGTGAAVVTVLRAGAVARSRHADGIREPLFALPWLNDPALPHLLDWQRRCALIKWRRGGAAIGVVVLAAVPDGAAIPKVAGLLLLVLSLGWLAVVMRACAEATMDAIRLLEATPLPAGRMRSSSLRYPLVAVVCAVILAVVGVLLMRGSWVAVAAWIGCLVAGSAWSCHRMIAATNAGPLT
ncbi:MAG: hypothetical protein ACREP2_14190 [Rhodanobacteraceae bacterium]